jgi:BirA family biotin operon repressor/biotin-[acetyl-CoA-carboxylase] ligase
MGRPWTTVPGASLALSVALERRVPSSNWQGLSIAVGAVLVDHLIESEEAPPSLKLKWPNDLWIDGRKIGGILIEVRREVSREARGNSGVGQGGQGDQQGGDNPPLTPIERVVIGVGLNRFEHPALAALDVPAGALNRGPVPEPVKDPVDLAIQVVSAILDASFRLETRGLADLLPLWRARDALAGLSVLVQDPRGASWSGMAAGIDDGGALQVQCEGTPPQIRKVIAGDVSVRAQATEERHDLLSHAVPTEDVLTYGSLMFEPVWSAVVTGQYSSRAVQVDGWQRYVIPGEDYPGAVLSAGSSMTAVIWEGVGAEDLARLDAFEGDQYERVRVLVDLESRPAWIYAWRGERALTSTLWDPDAFAQPGVMERFLARHLLGAEPFRGGN